MLVLRRGVFLLLGAVVALPYALAAGILVRAVVTSGDNRGGAIATALVALAVAGLPPFLGGTRELEITAARALLGADLPAHDRSRPLEVETRIRSALWFGLHLVAGTVVGALVVIAVPLALLAFAERLGLTHGVLTGLDVGPLTARSYWGWTLAGGLLLAATFFVTKGLGALATAMAPVLLGPSATEREAALAARERRLAERNRLARELHDSVGHALTASTLQAGAARAVFDQDPEFARRALGTIEELGRTALDELDAVLGVLRDGEPDRTTAPTLADVGRLLTPAVTAEIAPVDVPQQVSREAYRIVQECLTNAAKHGSGEVRLRIADEEGLIIEVTNRVGGRAGRQAGGRGLAGMHERVRLLGGEMTAGPAHGEWMTRVRLR